MNTRIRPRTPGARAALLVLGIAVLAAVLPTRPAAGQEVLLDGYRRVEGLMLFPALHEPNVYYYLPNRPALAMGKHGKPEFSFMRYAYTQTDEARASSAGGIQEAAGGGILHFLVTYEVPSEEIRKAAAKLQEENEDAKIAGPIIFKGGTFALVTSITDEEGKFSRRICGLGKAPLIEGNRAAVSIELTKLGASLLWESFKLDTPDISLVFTMEVYAYRQPYEAEMRVHWDKVHEEKDLDVGVKVLVLGGDIKMTFDKLQESGAIEIVTRGEHGTLDAIIQKAHAKLLDVMFEKQEPTAPTPAEEPGLAETLLGAASGRGGSGLSSYFSAHASYKLRKLERTGTLVMNLNHYSCEEMTTVMAANIGGLYKRYGDDPALFSTVSLDDPLYKQREIYVTIDGATAADFKDYINYVSVKIRKEHAGGALSVDEIVLDAVKFNEQKNSYRTQYPWKDDANLEDWLRYKYKTVWHYRGNLRSESGWLDESTSVLAVAPTAVHRVISIEGDPELLADAGVRYAKLDFRYNIFGQPKEKKLTIRTRPGSFPQTFDYIAQADDLNYTYDLTWVLRGGTQLEAKNVTESAEVIYVDELPEPPEENTNE